MSIAGFDDGAVVFERSRSRLLALAYRSLGSVSEADDVVQEAWLRWNRADRSAVTNPDGYLTAVTARLAIDRLRVRARERARYVGPWLPEPIDTRGPGTVQNIEVIADPFDLEAVVTDADELAADVTLGLMMLLERLDPVDRVVFILADVFREPFRSIAGIVGKDESACRQIASRARRRIIDEGRQRHLPTAEERAEVASAFMMAVYSGDAAQLIRLLAEDAVLLSDGGPERHAARRPVVTPERIARFMINVVHRLPADCSIRGTELNGEQGFIWEFATQEGLVVDGAIVLSVESRLVTGIYVQVNRAKLQHLAAGDAVAM